MESAFKGPIAHVVSRRDCVLGRLSASVDPG